MDFVLSQNSLFSCNHQIVTVRWNQFNQVLIHIVGIAEIKSSLYVIVSVC